MNTYIHIWGSYAFIAIYLLAVVLGVIALVKKNDGLARKSAWVFLGAFVLLALSYFVAFSLKESLLLGADEFVLRILEKHHKMAKFVLTGTILVACASASVLVKYRQEKLPQWFLPNLLFISWMVLTFLIRSLLQAYRLP